MIKRIVNGVVLAAGVAVIAMVFSPSPGVPGQARAASEMAVREPVRDGEQRAIFAGGCFWCMEQPFDELDGVRSTQSGYIGGTKENPTYREVSAGSTGHTEAVEVIYDPRKVSYEKLLDVFWVNIDPTVRDRQFCDSGSQYRSGIFPVDDAQRKAAEASREALDASGRLPGKVVTEVTAATTFYPAEVYHQNYYQKNPLRYAYYRYGCGRDARLQELWGDAAAH